MSTPHPNTEQRSFIEPHHEQTFLHRSRNYYCVPEPENESNYRIIRPESIRFGRIESNRIEFLEEKTESNRTECQFFK